MATEWNIQWGTQAMLIIHMVVKITYALKTLIYVMPEQTLL